MQPQENTQRSRQNRKKNEQNTQENQKKPLSITNTDSLMKADKFFYFACLPYIMMMIMHVQMGIPKLPVQYAFLIVGYALLVKFMRSEKRKRQSGEDNTTANTLSWFIFGYGFGFFAFNFFGNEILGVVLGAVSGFIAQNVANKYKLTTNHITLSLVLIWTFNALVAYNSSGPSITGGFDKFRYMYSIEMLDLNIFAIFIAIVAAVGAGKYIEDKIAEGKAKKANMKETNTNEEIKQNEEQQVDKEQPVANETTNPTSSQQQVDNDDDDDDDITEEEDTEPVALLTKDEEPKRKKVSKQYFIGDDQNETEGVFDRFLRKILK